MRPASRPNWVVETIDEVVNTTRGSTEWKIQVDLLGVKSWGKKILAIAMKTTDAWKMGAPDFPKWDLSFPCGNKSDRNFGDSRVPGPFYWTEIHVQFP